MLAMAKLHDRRGDFILSTPALGGCESRQESAPGQPGLDANQVRFRLAVLDALGLLGAFLQSANDGVQLATMNHRVHRCQCVPPVAIQWAKPGVRVATYRMQILDCRYLPQVGRQGLFQLYQ